MLKAESGVSLLEVIVVMVIAGILAAIAVPSFITTIKNNRLTTYTNDVVLGLMLARTESIKRNTPVIMCRSSTATGTAPACTTGAGSGGWEIGWFIYDTSTAAVLMRHEAYAGGITIIGNNNVANQLRYNSQGIVTAAGIGSLTVADGRGAPFGQRIICISAAGRARVASASATSCTGV